MLPIGIQAPDIALPCQTGETVSLYQDDKQLQPQVKEQKLKADALLKVTIQPQGGMVIKQ